MKSSPSFSEPGPSSASPVFAVVMTRHAIHADESAISASHAVLPPPPPSGINTAASTSGSSRRFLYEENHRLLPAQSVHPMDVHEHAYSDAARPSISQINRTITREAGHTEDTMSQPVYGEVRTASAVGMLPASEPPSAVVVVVPAEETQNRERGAAVAMRQHLDGQFSLGVVVAMSTLYDLPNEVLLHILGYLDVCDLLATSRVSQRLRSLSLAPILHAYRLRHARATLPPMLWSPFRPSLADLMRRSIYLTKTTIVSRKLARSLVCIRLSRRLATRPSLEVLVERSVLPPECLPSRKTVVAPALVAKKRAVERERVKDGLRRWVERVWTGEVRQRSESVKQWEERVGVGRVWRMRRFWERVGSGSNAGKH